MATTTTSFGVLVNPSDVATDDVVLDTTYYMSPPTPGMTGLDAFGASRFGAANTYHADIDVWSSPGDAPHTFPTPTTLGPLLSAVGIGEEHKEGGDAKVVVYDRHSVFAAPRIWFILRAYGFDARILSTTLDGVDQAQWVDASPLDSDVYAARMEANAEGAADVTLEVNQAMLAPHEDVALLAEKASDDVVVVDARSAGRFSGQDPEPRPEIPSGAMPNAVSLPYTELLVEDGTAYKPESDLNALISKVVGREGRNIISSCGSGVTACVLAAAAAHVGYPAQLRVYDDSWTGWQLRKMAAQDTVSE